MSGPRCVGVELASRDPMHLAEFYVDVLGFTVETATSDKVSLRLGEGFVWLLRALPKGRPIPCDSRSNDLWFRHVAIVVRDLPRAYDLLRAHGTAFISEAPQTLPAWNEKSGGIEALYFRDPEHHPLELIHFPSDKGKAVWKAPGDALFQGIDHTAIVVANSDASVEFYREKTGLVAEVAVVNHGIEQERLAHVDGARMHVVSLPGAGQMGFELIEYQNPRNARPIPSDTSPDDLWWSRTVIQRDGSAGPQSELIDPDNHRAFIK